MKKIKIALYALLICTSLLTLLPSCKKGSDDPVISLRTRKDRFTNTWTLAKYEKNGLNQDLNGTSYIYNIFNSGTLTQTIEGAIFGYPVKSVNSGTWSFENDDEDVRIIINADTNVYNIQRLASTELWLRKTVDASTYVYYFEGK